MKVKWRAETHWKVLRMLIKLDDFSCSSQNKHNLDASQECFFFFYFLVRYKSSSHMFNNCAADTLTRRRCRKCSTVSWECLIGSSTPPPLFLKTSPIQVSAFKGTQRSSTLTPLDGTVLSQWERLVFAVAGLRWAVHHRARQCLHPCYDVNVTWLPPRAE